MEQAPPQEVRIAAGASTNAGTPSAAPVPPEGAKSRKPANTRFKQQQLPAWQPMLTARSVLPFLVAIGLAFIPIGIALYLSASNVVEVITEYTDCHGKDNQPCSNGTYIQPKCVCEIDISLDRHMGGPVFMYYAMENFFQNHRKYVKSRDDNQLMGEWYDPNDKPGTPSTDCGPDFAKTSVDGKQKAYVPCGAIANSLFNDSIELFYNKESGKESVGLAKKDIAWDSDRSVKFANPDLEKEKMTLKEYMEAKNLVSPKNWQKPLYDLDTDESNNGLHNEDLIVWMRTAAFPSFRKLYRRINHTNEEFRDGLKPGNYSLVIQYNFPVKGFEGKKFIVLSSVSWIGGRNIFLGVAYMTVGSICIVLAVVFFLIHVKFGKKCRDYDNCRCLYHNVNNTWLPESGCLYDYEASRISMISDIAREFTVYDDMKKGQNEASLKVHNGTNKYKPLQSIHEEILLKPVEEYVRADQLGSAGKSEETESLQENLLHKAETVYSEMSDEQVRENCGDGQKKSDNKLVPAALRETASQNEIRARKRLMLVIPPVLVD